MKAQLRVRLPPNKGRAIAGYPAASSDGCWLWMPYMPARDSLPAHLDSRLCFLPENYLVIAP